MNLFSKKLLSVLLLFSGIIYVMGSCYLSREVVTENRFEPTHLGSFVENDFPYITVPLDARNLGESFPDHNVTARGLALRLGNGSYACFDMDLLRWSVAWEGDFLPMVLPAQVSYANFFKKNNNELPVISGNPKLATGLYPGWSVGKPVLAEVRSENQEVEGLHWGPLPPHLGKWKGVYPYAQSAILAYQIGTTDILELPGSLRDEGMVAFTRSFKIGKSTDKLFLTAAEVRNGTGEVDQNTGWIYTGESGDSVTAVSVKGANGIVKTLNSRFLNIEIPPSDSDRTFTVVMWKGHRLDKPRFERLVANTESSFPDFRKKNPARWRETVITKGKLSPDTAAFVTDVLTLPVPNPWKRNIRVADISFFSGNKAAVSTYEGDIWIVEGIDHNLNRLKWRRFASGFYEPMSLEIYKDQIYVYAKEGIVRLHDLNGDGEADFYENFCNLMHQSTGTREWAADMVADKEGNFYIAKGGHVTGFKGVLPYLTGLPQKNQWRASTRHSGSVLKVSADGRQVEVIATGLRMPYIGLNRDNEFLSASDQQGNFVPATPIYNVNSGDYFGVPVTLHRQTEPAPKPPIVWIPHRIERSGASQVWVTSDKMGPLNNQMLHLSFGRPGIFRVLIDTASQALQGGVSFLPTHYPSPVIKGEVNPKDGQLYVAGFNNFASNSQGISSLIRLRYTKQESYMLSGFQAGDKGIVLSFDTRLDEKSIEPQHFQVRRWNYKRTEQYGSGHYKLDGTPGEELLPVISSLLSDDRKKLFLAIPDMKEVEQVEVLYKISAEDSTKIDDGVWLTVNRLSKIATQEFGVEGKEFNLTVAAGLRNPIPHRELETPTASMELGREMFTKMACIGCHSTELRTEGMYGPPFQKLYGSIKLFADGTSSTVDEAYLKESILEPAKKVVKGYNAEMPSFSGILSEVETESLILYIKSL